MKTVAAGVLSAVCAGGLFAPSFAAAEYDSTTQPGDLIVTVAEGSEPLDVSWVTDGVTNIVKRGAGTLTSDAGLADYTGDITIETGIWSYTAVGALGAANVGTVTVAKDAQLLQFYTDTGKNVALHTGKTIVLAGDGPDGKGAFYVGSGVFNNSSGSKFHLADDAMIGQSARFDLRGSGSIDCHGHKLIVRAPGSTAQFSASGSAAILNAADILISNITWNIECEWTITGSEGAKIRLCKVTFDPRSAGTLVTTDLPVEVSGGTSFGSSKTQSNNRSGHDRLDAAMTLAGKVTFARKQGTGFTVSKPLSGTGTLVAGPGRLYIDTAENAYAGEVKISGEAPLGDPSWTRAGITLRPGATFSSAAGKPVKITEGDFAFPADQAYAFDAFEAVAGEVKITSEVMNGAVRSTMASLVNSSPDTLTVSAPLDIASVDVRAGTLKVDVPASAILAHPGLYSATEGNGNFDKIDRIEALEQTVDPKGPSAAFNKSLWEGIGVGQTYFYHGYLWNRTDHDVTWTICVNCVNRSYLWINRVLMHDNVSMSSDTNNWSQVTLKPGPNEFHFNIQYHSSSANPGPNNSTLSLSYDPEGRGETNSYKKAKTLLQLSDGGDGSLFTIDTATPADVRRELWSTYAPTFAAATFATNTTFDLNGEDAAVAHLTGLPAIAGGDLEVTGEWTVDAGETALGAKLVTAGALTLAEDAKVSVVAAGRIRTSPKDGWTVAEAAGGITLPEGWQADAVLPDSSYSLRLSDDGKRLTLFHTPGAIIILR